MEGCGGVAVDIEEQPDLIHERLIRVDLRRTAALAADEVKRAVAVLCEDDRLTRHSSWWHRQELVRRRGRVTLGGMSEGATQAGRQQLAEPPGLRRRQRRSAATSSATRCPRSARLTHGR